MNLKTPLIAGLALALAAAPAIAAKHHRPTVKAPKAGSYSGFNAQKRDVLLYVNSKSLDYAGFAFKCGKTSGRTSLNSIPLK
jgi:hypothetical protein